MEESPAANRLRKWLVPVLFCALVLPQLHQAVNAKPLPRVVSINICTDQLVMLLAEPDQIAALSSLSRDSAGSYYYKKAEEFAQAAPIAEDLLPLAPDVVVTGPYTSRYTLSLLNELGIRVVSLPIANSIEDMLANLMQVGDTLGQTARATSIVGDVRKRLDAVAARLENFGAETKPKAVVYDTNGYTVGSQTVRGQAIELSGWTNVATSQGISAYGILGLEQLISLQPQALIESSYSTGTYSRGQMVARHPAIQSAGLNPLIIKVPSNQTMCAGPWTIDVVEQLLEVRIAFQ